MADRKAGGNSFDPKDKLFEAFKQPIKIRNLAESTLSFNLEEHNQGGKVRQPFDLSLSRAVFKEGQHSLQIDSKLLSQLWKVCMEAQATKDRDDVLSKTLFEGAFEVKWDQSQVGRGVNVVIDSFSTSEQYAIRVDGVNQVRYRVGYLCVSDKGQLAKLGKRELYAECIEIAKRVKNANCDSKFYTSQLAKDASLDNRALQQTRLSFEAQTQALSPLDFSRLHFTIFADHAEHRLHVATHFILPSLAFTFQPIPSLKFNVAPLSKILLNKLSPGDLTTQSNFSKTGVYSGFVTLDSKNRVLPLMPNDPSTLGQRVCGVWIYGFEDVRCPYVWSACARFIFCTNFKDAKGGKVPLYQRPGEQPQFLLVVIDRNHRTQFFSLRQKTGCEPDNIGQWMVFSHSQAIDREPNLYFRTYVIRDVFKSMKHMPIKDYLESDQRIQQIANDDEANESRIKILQNAMVVTNSPPSKKSQTHRLVQNQLSSRGKTGLSLTGTFHVSQSFKMEETKSEEEPQPMQLNLVPHEMKHFAQAQHGHAGQKAVNRSRNSLSQNRLQQQLLEVKQEPNESQTDDDDMVQIRQSNQNQDDDFHGTLRTWRRFQDQQNRIKELESQLASMQTHVQHLNEVIQSQQRQINESKNTSHLNHSGSTTAYLSRTPHSREDSNNTRTLHINFQQINQAFGQTGTFRTPDSVVMQHQNSINNAVNYQAQAFDQILQHKPAKNQVSPQINNIFRLSQEILNLEAPSLISQPTGNFAHRESPVDSRHEEYNQKLVLGQLETRERFEIPRPDHHSEVKEDQEELSSGNSSVFEQSEIPIPDSKSMGDKRSRNKGGHQILPQLKHIQENNTLDNHDAPNIQDFNEIAQSQTLSEVSNSNLQGGDSSNSRLHRSHSSTMGTMAQELKAIKSDLKQQYDNQLVSNRRPKGSRNVLNTNVVMPPGANHNLGALNKKLPRIPSSSSSSENSSADQDSDNDVTKAKLGGRGDIDHTYNPYSFKKLEKAIFKKPAQQPHPTQPQLQQTQPKDVQILSKSEEQKIFVHQLPQQHQHQQDERKYSYGGKTDWTMELPRISFEVNKAAQEDNSDDQDEIDSGFSDSDDDFHPSNDQHIIKVEDIKISSQRPPQKKEMYRPLKAAQSDDDEESSEDQISEVERKYLVNIKR